MRAGEITANSADFANLARLSALAEFMSKRSTDENVRKEMSAEAFLNLAKQRGISLSLEQLKDLAQQTPLSNFVADIKGSNENPTLAKIIFQPSSVEPDQMDKDQAQATVDSMAKRAAKKNL